MKLFDIKPVKTQPTNTCRQCIHIQRWPCNSKYFHYCAIRKSKRTDNGLLKVKCKNDACGAFETNK